MQCTRSEMLVADLRNAVIPPPWSYRPVIQVARVGEHAGAVAYW